MELLFLLSDISAGGGQELLRSVSGPASWHVVAFVSNYDSISSLKGQFPQVTWIVLDAGRSATKACEFLKVIPLPNYLVNFNGQSFSEAILPTLASGGNAYKERERGQSELTFDGIVDEEDGEECKIFVNVVEKRSGFKRKSKTITKTVGRLMKGAKKKLANLASDEDSTEENEPLISAPRNDTPAPSGFFASLLTTCCSCVFKPPGPEYCFQNPQELRLQLRSEQIRELHEALQRLHDSSFQKWNSTLDDLQSNESQEIEELVSRIDDLRNREEQELNLLKDKQNQTTRQNLSGVLNPETIRKIEESRSRQTKGKTQYDADTAFREGQSGITKRFALSKAKLQECHYNKLVQDQLQALRVIDVKYKRKVQTLQARHFGYRL